MEKNINNINIKEIVYKKDIVEYENVFTQEECEYLINYWNTLDDWSLGCFYNSYTISGKKKNTIDGAQYLEQVKQKSQDLAEKVFNRKLKLLSLSAHKWHEGAFAADHSDNAELDGTPNAWEENKLVTMIYLNDNFEGGNLTFRDHELAFKPKMGSVIVFDVGIDNVHAVTEVKSGTRYTMLISYDYIESQYNTDFNKIKQELKYSQDKLKEEWSQGIIMPTTSASEYIPVN
jgi:hypothetical protein